MQKQKRITLNADKRKVIADVFQNHFEDNSKFKKAWQQAKETYNDMRSITMIIVSMFKLIHQRLKKTIMIIREKSMMMFILSLATWIKTF